MSIYITPVNQPLQVVFELDATLMEDREDQWEWTDQEVELQPDITPYGRERPKLFTAEGIVTAHPFSGIAGPMRPTKAYDLLVSLGALKQQVVLVGTRWSPTVVITRCKAMQSPSIGEALRIQINFKTIRTPSPTTTTIPASKLKKRVRRSGTPKKNGGAANAGEAIATGKCKDWRRTTRKMPSRAQLIAKCRT
jgi:hypothetical protein